MSLPSQEMMQLMSDKIRVLIVDDSLDLRLILEKFLHFHVPEVEVVALAENGTQAIELTKQHQPDIVLMDINLPDIDGITATQTIIQARPSSQIILMSGEENPETIHGSMQAGARRLFVKPIDSDELITTIRTIHTPCAGADRSVAATPLGSNPQTEI